MPAWFLNSLKVNQGHFQENDRWKAFTVVFLKIADYVCSEKCTTIDEITSQLVEDWLITSDIDNQRLLSVRYMVFSILGWQTMPYRPAVIQENPEEFTIQDEQNGYRGQAYISLLQDIRTGSKEILGELLMGFGVPLPSKNICLSDDTEEQKIFHQRLEISTKALNANLLVSIAGIRIRWIDNLTCHMEYNPATKELYLFRFPLFCLSCLSSTKKDSRSVIHSFATASNYICQWATESDIDCMLREILQSYRLLFGQSKKSRALFRLINPYAGLSANLHDPILATLCSSRSCHLLDLSERGTYYLPQDFPVLRYRISMLQMHLSKTAPRTWSQLWHDKRDSAQWLTFWAVISFGACGTLLALLQVILQLVQVVMT